MEGAEFLRRMRLGEAQRRQLLTTLYPELLRRARTVSRLGGLYRPEDADEVLQDTCIAILTKWPEFRGESSLWTWVWRIMSNLVAGHHRFNGRWDRHQPAAGLEADEDGEGDAPGARVAEAPDSAELGLCLAQVIARLEDERGARAGSVRTIDLLTFVAEAGPDTAALAEYLRCTEAAAKERKRYALQKLRDLCAHYCGHDDCSVSGAR